MFYEVVTQTPKEIVMIYVVFCGACLVTFPLMKLLINAISKGVSKWT